MASNISIREYIQWLPDKPSEPTTTLVLTSAESRLVDIRLLRPTHGSNVDEEHEDVLPFSRLNWAFGGTSSSKIVRNPDGEEVLHSTWRHWVDSNSLTPEDIKDEGDMFPQPDGERTLEKGSMVNPATGKMTDYVECWRDVAAVPVKGEEVRVCVVLMLHDDANKARGMVIRLGQYCQGVVRVGEDFALERWEWKGGKKDEGLGMGRQRQGDERSAGWKRSARVGDWWLPCGAAMDEHLLKLGGEVKHQDMVWKAVELSCF